MRAVGGFGCRGGTDPPRGRVQQLLLYIEQGELQTLERDRDGVFRCRSRSGGGIELLDWFELAGPQAHPAVSAGEGRLEVPQVAQGWERVVDRRYETARGVR